MTVQTLAIIVLLVSFFVMIFLRFPIAYAVGLSSVLCMLVQGQALTDVCRLMVKGISSSSAAFPVLLPPIPLPSVLS